MALKAVFFLCILFKTTHCSYFEDDVVSKEQPECQCVPSHLCADNDPAYNGDDALDIRMVDDSCPNYDEVCCETPLQEPPPTEIAPQGCGYSNAEALIGPRITSNSELTEFGELPWMVLVLQKDKKTERNTLICGGSLIHPQVVLTAGHCVNPEAAIKVRAGEWNLRKNNEPLPHQDGTVKEALVHPQYKPGTLWNDVALLILEKPLLPAKNVAFICLPPRSLKINETKCIASGWGKNAFLRSKHSPVLRKVSLPLVSRTKCQMALRTTRLGKFYKLHRSFICAGGEKNKDTCKGDGGSPLICPVQDEKGTRFVQMGIVSWGIGCGTNKTPGVYVNVALYYEWIDKQLQARHLSTSHYKLA